MLATLPAWMLASIAGFFGLLIGSFLNVVIHRTPLIMYRQWLRESSDNLMAADPAMGVNVSLWDLVFSGKVSPPAHLYSSAEAAGEALESLPVLGLAKPRSRCAHCDAAIAWYQNIPVLSYLALGGRCAGCGQRISVRYPLVEIATGLIFGLCAYRWGLTITAAAWCAFAAILICQFMIDLDTQLLPDSLNYLLLWLGLVASLLGLTVPLASSVWGAVAGYLVLWTIYHLYRLATGKEGMGYGDFKLLAALGAWLGADYLLAVVLVSSAVGAVLGTGMLVVGRLSNKDVPIAFGPFLAGAGLVCLVVGPEQVRAFVPFAFPLVMR
ncbi:MAG: prepilin peptidase [Pseudomonadota bacterium]